MIIDRPHSADLVRLLAVELGISDEHDDDEAEPLAEGVVIAAMAAAGIQCVRAGPTQHARFGLSRVDRFVKNWRAEHGIQRDLHLLTGPRGCGYTRQRRTAELERPTGAAGDRTASVP